MNRMQTLAEKKTALQANLREKGSLLVAFSGGVDSTLLLAVAKEVLRDRVTAVTAVSSIHPLKEQTAARELASRIGVRHLLFESRELDTEAFRANPPERCYVCKKLLFGEFLKMAKDLGLSHVVHGANLDDLNDYRPGLQATRELGVQAPLLEAGLTKDDVRNLSREMGLPTWQKPAMACLATRIPYGTPITGEKVRMIAEAEDFILDLGFTSCRVRLHDEVARIEVLPDEIERMVDGNLRATIAERLKKIGFLYIAVDVEGYQSGRMNRSLAHSKAGT